MKAQTSLNLSTSINRICCRRVRQQMLAEPQGAYAASSAAELS